MKSSSPSKPNSLMGFNVFDKLENISWIAKESWISRLVQGALLRHACGFSPFKTYIYLQTRGLHQHYPASCPQTSAVAAAVISVPCDLEPRNKACIRFAALLSDLGKRAKADPSWQPTWFRAESRAGRTTPPSFCSEDVVDDSSVCQCPLMDTVTAPRSRSLQSEPPTFTCLSASNVRCAENPTNCLA